MVQVKLRKRRISGDRYSLYLDFYPAIPKPGSGEPTRRETLYMYMLKNPKTEFEKKANKETFHKAQIIAGKRQADLHDEEYGFLDKRKYSADFIHYFTTIASKRSGTNSDNWQSSLNHLKDFAGKSKPFRDISIQWCNDFKTYLLNAKRRRSKILKLSKSSADSYLSKFIAALKAAYKEGYLKKDLGSSITRIKVEPSHRNYLTMDELQRLANTNCSNPVLKRAALCSALTGMRFSDLEKLIWKEVVETDSGHEIQFVQKKTNGAEILPISNLTMKILGSRCAPDSKVFDGLKYSPSTNKQLKSWMQNAGITKHCGFHSFRHTNATQLLDHDVDLYVISKLLGHKDISTTELYTKVLDKKKIEAANKIIFEI